jgi:hypothetical protein
MLSDSSLSIAGHTISSLELLIAGALLLCAAAFLLAVSRRNRVTLQRSAVSDEIAILLGRIADAAERMADQPGGPSLAAAAGTDRAPAPVKLTERSHAIPYSIFGREQ